MDPLDFLESNELLRFLHCHKTELSCIEKPHTLLSQLRDHNLIPDERFKKLINMRSRDNIKKSLYDLLDWFETRQSEHIRLFWRCLFKEPVMNTYPSLKMMRRSLMDGSFHEDSQYPAFVDKKEKNCGKRSTTSDDEETGTPKKKRQQEKDHTSNEEDNRPGPSSLSTSGQKRRSKRVSFNSPLKKGEQVAIWSWDLFRSHLPVTCGSQKGTLSRERMAKGEKCITVDNKWFTPSEFEKFAGKERCKNWKTSIRCQGTPLANLIEEGHLTSPSNRKKKQTQSVKVRKTLLPGSTLTMSDTEEEDEDDDEDEEEEDEEDHDMETHRRPNSSAEDGERIEQTEQTEQTQQTQQTQQTEQTQQTQQTEQTEQTGDRCQVFTVTCEGLTGKLHQQRFATGTLGKCIRTEQSWLTPVEFTQEATSQTNISWKKDIKCEGEPLYTFIQTGVLPVHSLLCKCRLCSPIDQENQKNDDDCCVCRKRGHVVLCDECPLSFHQHCHLPHIRDAIVKETKPWMCTFCVAKQPYLQRPKQKTEAAMALPVSSNMLFCEHFLLSLLTAEETRAAASNLSPDPHLDGDSNTDHIMRCLDFVAKKLQEKKYVNVGDLLEDIRLAFTNSDDPDHSENTGHLQQLKDLVNNKFKEVFNVVEENVDCFEQT